MDDLTPKTNPHKKRDTIISTSFLLLLFLIEIYCYISNCCSIKAEFTFQCLYNQKTGDALSVPISIFLYVLLSWFVAFAPIIINLFPLWFLWRLIYIRDRRFYDRRYKPAYEKEMENSFQLGFVLSYVVAFAVVFFHAVGVLTHA